MTRHTLKQFRSGTALAFLVVMPLQAQNGIRLQHGIYVEVGNACKDAPFAVLKAWDGVGLSGAHSSHCVTEVLGRSANDGGGQAAHVLHVKTTCVALGDGTRIPPDVENADLQVLGPQSFRYTRQVPGGRVDAATYRWCSARE